MRALLLLALGSGRAAAQAILPGQTLCACESCVAKENSVADCESFGIPCDCFTGTDCESCMGKGNTAATCEGFGLPCSHGHKGHGKDSTCDDLTRRSAAVNEECCDEPTEDCSLGTPSTCNLGCANVLLPFFADCGSSLGDAFQQFVEVVAMCQAAVPGGSHVVPPPPPPLPPPPPAPVTSPTFEVSSGSCTTSPGGECVRSPGYPNNYPASSSCTITVSGSGGVRATAFRTETRYDYVTLAGNRYDGDGQLLASPGVPVVDGSTISFHADSSNQLSGFEVCGTALQCGEHGRSNADGTACTCDRDYFGRSIPEPGGSVCDGGPYPEQYEVTKCVDPENCGTYSRVQAQCTGGNCDIGNPSTCGYAPLYEKAGGANPSPGGPRVLYRWVLQDGSSMWRVGRSARADCIGIPTARTSSKRGAVGMADDDSYGSWQESASSGWVDSAAMEVQPVIRRGGGH